MLKIINIFLFTIFICLHLNSFGLFEFFFQIDTYFLIQTSLKLIILLSPLEITNMSCTDCLKSHKFTNLF